MSDKIRMTHPTIDGSEYLADPLQVPHLEEAGWEVADGEDDSQVERWPDDLRRFEGQPKVELYHPQTGGYYTAPESAVPYHREKGWLVVGSDDYRVAQGQQFDDKTVEELREVARERGLKVSGTKDELLARLQGEETTSTNEAGEQPASEQEEE